MKNKIAITLCIIVGFGCFFLLKKIIELNSKNEQKNHVESFEYLSLEEKKSTFNLNNTQNTLFIYFNSECEFCQMKARDIFENKMIIKDYKLFFISEEEIDSIKKFSKEWRLNNAENIHFIKDYNHSFKDKFDIKTIPSIVFYTKKNIVFYSGNYSIKYILNEANKEDNQ